MSYISSIDVVPTPTVIPPSRGGAIIQEFHSIFERSYIFPCFQGSRLALVPPNTFAKKKKDRRVWSSKAFPERQVTVPTERQSFSRGDTSHYSRRRPSVRQNNSFRQMPGDTLILVEKAQCGDETSSWRRVPGE